MVNATITGNTVKEPGTFALNGIRVDAGATAGDASTVCVNLIGNDATVAWAGASGAFELNVQIPVMALGVLESMRLLANASEVLAVKTVDGITANVERARFLAEASPSIVTPLNRVIGYENAAKIAKHAVKAGLTVREATIDLGFVERGEISLEQLDQLGAHLATALQVAHLEVAPRHVEAEQLARRIGALHLVGRDGGAQLQCVGLFAGLGPGGCRPQGQQAGGRQAAGFNATHGLPSLLARRPRRT